MRILVLGAVAFLTFTIPASAQMMCGPGQAQSQWSTPAYVMCGMGQAAVDDPMADKPATPPQRQGMCPCCRGMAMMRPQGSASEMPKH
jgi:hypothetical protein